MDTATFQSVDDYLNERLIKKNDALEGALRRSEENGLPPIQVAPNQGKLLQMFAQLVGAKRVLEVGTLGGYSTIWLAEVLPTGGKLITLEFEPLHAEVAGKNVADAGLSGVVEIRVGDAAESLSKLEAENPEPFDLVFIDADKKSNPTYFKWALRHTRSGGLIIVDNVVRNGAVVDAGSEDPDIKGVQAVLDIIGKEPRVTATALQTVGAKGYDGFAIALVK
jgi:predicted O-methyltransferase YrrM